MNFLWCGCRPTITKSRWASPAPARDGYASTQLLKEIHDRVSAIIRRQREIIHDVLHELSQHGVHIRSLNALSLHLREAVRAYFHEEIYPVLTPLAADHARPFPFISNLSLNLGVYVIRDAGDHNGQYDPDELDL
ncbi:hypothetical protein HC928_24555 [bacterium]|nr:hypothetical protein [bacterium]